MTLVVRARMSAPFGCYLYHFYLRQAQIATDIFYLLH